MTQGNLKVLPVDCYGRWNNVTAGEAMLRQVKQCYGGWNIPNAQIAIDVAKCRFPVGIYLLNVNNRNTKTRCEICSK